MTSNARAQSRSLADLLSREHAAMGEFIVALAEFDRQRLWVELGYSSLFYFLKRELGMSSGAAQYRMSAAQLARRYPAVVEALRDGRLCISTVIELGKVITPENASDVLPRFFETSKREAKEIVADLLPERPAPHRAVIRGVAAGHRTTAAAGASHPRGSRGADARAGAGSVADASAPSGDLARACTASHESPAGSTPAQVPCLDPTTDGVEHRSSAPAISGPANPSASSPARGALPDTPDSASRGTSRTAEDCIDVVGKGLLRMHVTVSKGFTEKLKTARAALSHALPGASIEQILECGLDLIVARHAARKGRVQKPRMRTKSSANPNYVPADVKRAVWGRDGGRCQWALENGGVCGSQTRIQFDHRIPRGRGGPSTVENLRLLCGFHNQVAAEKTYGRSWMARFRPALSGPGLPVGAETCLRVEADHRDDVAPGKKLTLARDGGGDGFGRPALARSTG